MPRIGVGEKGVVLPEDCLEEWCGRYSSLLAHKTKASSPSEKSCIEVLMWPWEILKFR